MNTFCTLLNFRGKDVYILLAWILITFEIQITNIENKQIHYFEILKIKIHFNYTWGGLVMLQAATLN